MLTTIKVEVFESLASLKRLNLEGNKLKFISANLLSSLNKIKFADLRNNLCIDINFPDATKKIIEETIIDNCVLPIEIKCSNEAEKAKAEENFAQLCKVQDLIVQYPKTRISKVNLAEENSNLQLLTFEVADQSMKFIPFKLSTAFPNLTSIVILRSKLSFLHKTDFEDFKSLKKIEITHNNMSSVEDGTFDGLTQLEFLDLSSNKIISLPSKIFSQLKNVQMLILSSNEIERFTADLLPLRNAIEEFRIDNNKLEFIETKTLPYLRKAKLIDFSGNTCIDMKFEKSQNNRHALLELSGEIILSCSLTD